MQHTRYVVMFIAVLSGLPYSAAAGAPASGQDNHPAAVAPLKPETRQGSPEDEALKRLLGQRNSGKGIMLSSGPLARPHKVLGAVSVEAAKPQGAADTAVGPNLYMNEVLRKKAVDKYGVDKVDGIINVKYEPGADGKVHISGTAVQFETTPPAKAHPEKAHPEKPASGKHAPQ